MSFDEIHKWWDVAIGQKVHLHLQSVADFYFRPVVFWKNYDGLLTKDKVVQFITYVFIFVLILFCCEMVSSIHQGVKVVLMDLMRLFPYFLCVLIALILSHIGSLPSNLISKGLVFVAYLYLLFIPIQVLFLLIFRYSENYLFYSVALLVSIVIDIYVMVVPCMAFLGNWKSRLVYILIWVLLISMCDVLYVKCDIRDSNEAFADVITEERYELGISISNPYLIPVTVITDTGGMALGYYYCTPVDTEATLGEEDQKYFAQLERDIDSLVCIIPRAKYKINRDFFKGMYDLKKCILFVNQNRKYLSNPVEDTKKTSRGLLEYRVFSKECSEMNRNLLQEDVRYQQKFERAKRVCYIRYLYRPYLLWKYVENCKGGSDV